MNPDDKQLQRAAQKMMCAMSAGMAAITCREPLLQSIQGYLKQALSSQLNFPPDSQKQLEDIVAQLAEYSVDQAVNYIVKNASDKAVSNIDAALENEYTLRAQCRAEGRMFKPEPQLTSLNSKLPDALKISVGTIDDDAFRVYEEFTKTAFCQENVSEEIGDSLRRANFGVERAASTTNFEIQRIQSGQNLRPTIDRYVFE